MTTSRFIATALAAALAAAAGCRDKDRKQTPQPPPPQTTHPLAPSTQPEEYLDPATIFARLNQSGEYEPVLTAAEGGRVDWGRGVVHATGQAVAAGPGPQDRLMALRAAETLAKRNALLLAAGLSIDGERRVHGLPGAAGEVQAAGTIGLFQVARRDFAPDSRTAAVTIEVPMYGLQGIVRFDAPGQPGPAAPGQPWTWRVKAPASLPAEVVLIDARRVSFAPVLVPRLVTGDGQVVFDPARRDDAGTCPAGPPGPLGQRHAFLFVGSRKLSESLGAGDFANVLVLRPARAAKGALVLGEEDLAELMACPNARELLRAGRAVIVLYRCPPATSRD